MPLVTRQANTGIIFTQDADPATEALAGNLWAQTNAETIQRRNDADSAWSIMALLSQAQAWTADQTFNDNVNTTYGTGGDADIAYNGTDLVINPQVVGGGNIQQGAGNYDLNDNDLISAAIITYKTQVALTIAAGVVTITQLLHSLAGEGGVADDLDTANNTAGDGVMFTASNSSITITLKDGTGNLQMAGDFALTINTDTWWGQTFADTNLKEVSRSDNGV